MPRLFGRRSTRKISAALAGLLACANLVPGTMRGTLAAQSGPEPAPQGGSEESQWIAESGSASWYGASRHYRRTASGEAFNQNAMTAAHPWLPFGTKVRVTRRDTGHSIVVVINDRLPSKRHIIDLSLGAARQLGMVQSGTTQVTLEPA